MENKYLNEERYQRGKKKLVLISLIILILGIILGSGLIVTGITKTKSSKEEAKQINNQKALEAQARLDEIKIEKDNLQEQYDTKSQECDSLDHWDPNWFANVNQCRREASEINKKISSLELEKISLKNYEQIEPNMAYVILCVLGVFVIIIGCSISFSIFMFTKRREIIAFGAQQVMPVAKEGIETMSPTIGNAVGTIGKEIAKGISEGIRDAKDE